MNTVDDDPPLVSRSGRHARARPGPPPRPPVFADPSGRRPRRMRLVGMAAGTVLLGCLAFMTVGLLGGPQASFIHWSSKHPAAPAGVRPASPGGAASGRMSPRSTPAGRLSPQASPSSDAPPAATGGQPAPATSPPVVTNRASKTPPGQNRIPAQHPSGRPSAR